MPFSIRPYRRFPIQRAVTYHVGTLLKFPLACCLGFWLLITLLVLRVDRRMEWVLVSS
jgi:hypothetical protein